ncbi:N-acetyltransferase O1 (Establishment of cohesion protein 1) [Cyanidiococcus yangmingshanensis]|uniref:N-acetyltransferase O1 (Establishment of cohesion protein 1) n=1 Tax=Cyanidiococcus yangmingshanensis TaxID=2690220 RepID=A0A7J7IRK3_9RHOD|nr:N-acetyltransferase O1 (Establishment of cohesion protein 1) [Cyanidiococcus yangmingshanensis]
MSPAPRAGAPSPGAIGRGNDSGDEGSLSGGCGVDGCGRRRDDRLPKPGLSVSCRWSISHLPGSPMKSVDAAMVGDRAQVGPSTASSPGTADGGSFRVGSPGGWQPTRYLGKSDGALSRFASEGIGPPVQSLGRERLEQTFLDLGQRGASSPVTCPECGYTYVIGVASDERAHANEHQLALYGVLLTRIRFLDAAVISGQDSERPWRAQELVPGWVVRVGNAGSSSRTTQDRGSSGPILHVQQRWFRTLWRLACKDWNAQAQTIDDPLSIKGESFPHDSTVSIFAYVGKQRRNAIGVVVARRLELPETPSVDQRCVPWCGIERIWVHAAFRRRGVATALADVARAHIWAATVVPRHRCAFTELTSAGDAFASVYVGGP